MVAHEQIDQIDLAQIRHLQGGGAAQLAHSGIGVNPRGHTGSKAGEQHNTAHQSGVKEDIDAISKTMPAFVVIGCSRGTGYKSICISFSLQTMFRIFKRCPENIYTVSIILMPE